MAKSTRGFHCQRVWIDELTRSDHYHLEQSDKCAFIREYTPRTGYRYSQTNQLVLNLKKPMERRGLSDWKYKRTAILDAARLFRSALTPEELDLHTFVPVPPSKARDDPSHDNRMSQVIQAMRPSRSVDGRELIVQVASTEAVHDSDLRLKPREIAALYSDR